MPSSQLIAEKYNMPLGNTIPDKTLLKNIQMRLAKKCSTSPKVTVDVCSGEVTMIGTIRQEHERKQVTKCVSSVQGVYRVIDKIKLMEPKKDE